MAGGQGQVGSCGSFLEFVAGGVLEVVAVIAEADGPHGVGGLGHGGVQGADGAGDQVRVAGPGQGRVRAGGLVGGVQALSGAARRELIERCRVVKSGPADFAPGDHHRLLGHPDGDGSHLDA
ncbi:hypothetical protein [Kitasatospora sp. NPDC057223]|uniref:hypothetical protein n=1 Tax=Kitasatospora sp. NPDC057223 TaxID=3346055 RepID=UPI003632954F